MEEGGSIMTALTARRPTTRRRYRVISQRAALWESKKQDVPSGYFGTEDTLEYAANALRSSQEYSADVKCMSTATGCDAQMVQVLELDDRDTELPLSPGDRIAAIQASLSLNITDLAAVLGVARQTIYAWINGETDLQAANRERLLTVYRIAQEWDKQCHVPAEKVIRNTDAGGMSVVDMLKERDIREDDIIDRFAIMAKECMRQKEELDNERPPVAQIAEKHRFVLSSESDQQHAIDVFTGKRVVSD